MKSPTEFFFFNDTATTEIYTLSLHDALPIYLSKYPGEVQLELEGAFLDTQVIAGFNRKWGLPLPQALAVRSEEHTSELQSHSDLVCRLLLEKKREGAD